MDAKNQYKQVGKIIFIFAFIATALQILFSVLKIVTLNDTVMSFNGVLDWLITFGPIYLIAFPLSVFMFKKIPAENVESKKIKISKLLVYLIECVAVMYIGNSIGMYLSSLLSNGQATNPLILISSGNNIIQVIVLTIIAPIIEEMLFRKLIIDHTVVYGEKVAIFYSALTFALFHMNLFQFFYAFGLGLIFGYIYVKTRNIKYSIIIHLIVNFFGGIVAPFIISQIDYAALSNLELLSEAELASMVIPSFILVIYSFGLIILVIVGIILLIKNRKNVNFNHTELEIPKEKVFNTVYLNIFYILFFVICIGVIMLNLFI